MKHYLTITVSLLGETVYEKRFALSGNYIIGRNSERCHEVFLAFNNPTTVIVLPQASRHLSGFHCVLYEDACYHIIDGWGQNKSTNGLHLNGRRIEFATLCHGDIVFLGCQDISLLYESEENTAESDKETVSEIP